MSNIHPVILEDLASSWIGGAIEDCDRERLGTILTIAQYVTDLALNEWEKRGWLTYSPGPDGELYPIVPYYSDLHCPTVLTRNPDGEDANVQ